MLCAGRSPEQVAELEAAMDADPGAPAAVQGTQVPHPGGPQDDAGTGALVRPGWWVDDLEAARRENALVGQLTADAGGLA